MSEADESERWLRELVERERAAGYPAASDCPSLPRVRQAVLREKWSARDRRHIRSCPTCRQVEGDVRRELWHPTAAQLFEHSQRFLSSSDAQEATYHLEEDGCARCLRLAALLRADRFLRRLATRTRQGVAGAARLLNDALESCSGGRDSLRLTERLPDPIQTDRSWAPFEDGRTRGRLVQDDDGCWLELTRDDLSHDALVHALAGDARGRTFWQGFLLLCRRQPGELARLARGRIPGVLPKKNAVRLVDADVSLLEGGESEELYQAFQAAERDDPSAVPAWREWAGQALSRVSRDAGLRGWLGKIVTPEQPPAISRIWTSPTAASPAPSLTLRFPAVWSHPEALAARSDRPLHLSAASDDGRLQADLAEDGPRLVLEVRTKDPALNHALIRIAPAGADAPKAWYAILLLRPDVNDWYAAPATFNTADLRQDLQSNDLGVSIVAVDRDWRPGQDTRAVLDAVDRDREDPAGRAAWQAWLEHVERQWPNPTEYLQKLLDEVRARLGG